MLNKANRLTKHGSFNYVYNKGERFSMPQISLSLARGKKNVRVGFVVSNKLGKAVRRNLVKRRMRAAIQELLPGISGGQLVFVAKNGICQLDYPQIKAQMEELLVRGKLIKP